MDIIYYGQRVRWTDVRQLGSWVGERICMYRYRMVEDSGTGWYRMIFANHSTSHMRASFCCFSSFSGQHSKVSLAPTTSTCAGIPKVTTRWRSIPEVCAGKGGLAKSHSSDFQ